MLTEENSQDLERVQKNSLRLVLGDRYKSYQNALNLLNLQKLSERREMLCLKMAKKCPNNPKMSEFFTQNSKTHTMKTRHQEIFNVNFAHTQRLQKSPIIYMQKMLNDHIQTQKN